MFVNDGETVGVGRVKTRGPMVMAIRRCSVHVASNKIHLVQ